MIMKGIREMIIINNFVIFGMVLDLFIIWVDDEYYIVMFIFYWNLGI